MAVVALVVALLPGCGARGARGLRGLGPASTDTAEVIDFELLDARTHQPVRLSDFRGRPVLIHYFTTWCAPCEAEFQNDAVLLEEHAGRNDLQILGISLDLDGRKILPTFMDVHDFKYPILLADERSLHGETPFGPVRAIPASVLLDKDGRVAERFSGVVPLERLRKRLASVAP